MKYNELSKAQPQKSKIRVGRGIAAGRGKTAGRGTKGQGSRKSGGVRPGFEGGQTPLYMRLPKLRGFKSHRPKTEVIYTGQLDSFKKTEINNHELFEAGLIKSPHSAVKLLLKGDVKSAKKVHLQAVSQGAARALAAAGGGFEKTARQPAPKRPKAQSPLSSG